MSINGTGQMISISVGYPLKRNHLGTFDCNQCIGLLVVIGVQVFRKAFSSL